MAIASNSQTEIGLVAEVTLGTTPATPALVQQPFSSFSLNPSTAELTDTRKTGSRELSAVVVGNRTFSGTLAGPLSYGNYDSLLEGALMNTWTANVLKVGETLKSFSVEVAQSDINNYLLYKGVVVNGFTIDSPAEGLTNISFDLLALDMVSANTSVDATGYTAATINDAFKSCGGVITEGGVAIAYVNSVNLTLANNISPLNFWGGCNSNDYSIGNADIQGELSLFFANDTVLKKYLSGAYSSLSFTLEDGAGNALQFNLPRIKYSGASLEVAEGSGERLVSLPFRAVKDSTAGTGLVITRTPA